MLFTNALFYRLMSPLAVPIGEIGNHLASSPFQPCGSQDTARVGWAPVLPDSNALALTAGGFTLVSLRRQQKILPAAAVAEATAAKVAEIEHQQQRTVYRKERKELKEEVMVDLLPRALTRSTHTHAYIDPTAGLLVVDTASRDRAEELLSQLRSDLGALPVVPVRPSAWPAIAMTGWLQHGAAPEVITLGQQCELRDIQESSNVVRVRGQDLRSDEVLQHIEAGKRVMKAEIHWDGKASCLLDDTLALRRLAFDDELVSGAHGEEEDAAAQAAADLVLLGNTLGQLLADLLAEFGGEAA
ncbi:MAG: recombination-associated protein RdgC [Porticoccaceae bacterium]|nr:recombination-associated protein RdgC [Porticoccaceae bacterium]